MPAPTRRSAALLAVLAVLALALPVTVSAVLALLLLLATAVDVSSARAAHAVGGPGREVPAVLPRGARVTVAVTGLHLGDEVAQPAVPGLHAGPVLPGSGAWELVAERRGAHVLPPLTLRRSGRWGLASWTAPVGAPAALTVYPDLPAARRAALTARTLRRAAPGEGVRGPVGRGSEFEALRDYVPGDDVRLVNWRATARRDRPTSNVFRVEQSRRLLLAVDCGRLMGAPLLPGLSRLDAAVDAAAALALTATELGDRVGMVGFAADLRAAARVAQRGADDVLRALAGLTAESVDSDLELVLRALPRGQRTAVVVLTDLLDESAARGLLTTLPPLAAREALLVVSALDPGLRAVLATTPTDVAAAARQAAAADLAEARLRSRTLLRRAGVTVVEALPADLSATAVRAYLTRAR